MNGFCVCVCMFVCAAFVRAHWARWIVDRIVRKAEQSVAYWLHEVEGPQFRRTPFRLRFVGAAVRSLCASGGQ